MSPAAPSVAERLAAALRLRLLPLPIDTTPRRVYASLSSAAATLLTAAAAAAVPLPGDLDGNGFIDPADESLFLSIYGANAGDAAYDPSADLDANGRIDVSDLAILGAHAGAPGGTPDTTPPGLLVSLDDVPDDMNDLLVAPPDAFRITIQLDSGAHSLLDTGSLIVTSSEDMGPFSAGTDLAGQFTVTPTRAVWDVPAGLDLPRTSYFVTADVSDLAGNATSETFGFAVRDFPFGPPLGSLQEIHLDFDADRLLGPDDDFVESMRGFGLSSTADPALEASVRAALITEIVRRVHTYYGRNADGSPGPDPVNVLFSSSAPAGSHSRICIGGESPSGGAFLGSAALDTNNLVQQSDECALANTFGVFPHALDNHRGGEASFQNRFSPVCPSLGGTPLGEHIEDPAITAPSFTLGKASAAQAERFFDVLLAFDAFAQAVATATAHEDGHMLGLVAHGPAPGGLWGGTSGNKLDHNETTTGVTPSENFIMNSGASFTFDEVAGLNGAAPPVFRPLSAAYLRDRIVLDPTVAGLFPAPSLDSVAPGTLSFGGSTSVMLTLEGGGFVAGASGEMVRQGTGQSSPLISPVILDPETATASVWSFFTPPGTYDVYLFNGDGQVAVLTSGVVVE